MNTMNPVDCLKARFLLQYLGNTHSIFMIDLSVLQTMIRESLLLTDPERAYWLAGLARMTPEQTEKLKSILDRARNIPWTQALQHAVSKIAGGASNAVLSATH